MAKKMTAEEENEKYLKPCSYNKKVNCVQYPASNCDDIACDDCPMKIAKK